MVVPDEQQAQLTIGAQIEKLVELNERQRYTYDRETLVKMLDEALDRRRPQGKWAARLPREGMPRSPKAWPRRHYT